MKTSFFNKLLPFFLIPFFFVSSVSSEQFTDPFFIPKTFYLILCFFSFLFILGSFFILSKDDRKLKFNILDLGVFIFSAYYLMRLLFTTNHYFGELSSINIFISLSLYFIVRIGFSYDPILSPRSLSIVLLGLFITVFIQEIHGILQYIGVISVSNYTFKIRGAFGNPGPYSNFLVSVFPLALSFILFKNTNSKIDRISRFLSFIIVILILIIIPLTKARTSWIVVFAVSTLLFYFKFKNHPILKIIYDKLWKKIILFMVAVLIGTFCIQFLYNYKKDSSLGRLFIWRTTSEIIADNPIFGAGVNSFPEKHNEYQAKFFNSNPDTNVEGKVADNVKFAYNEYLQLSSEIGLFGLFIFLFIIVIFFISKPIDPTIYYKFYALKACILAILITALFSYPFHNSTILVLFYTFLGLISSFSSFKTIEFSINRKLLFLMGIILILFSIWQFNIHKVRWNANKVWAKTASLAQNGKLDYALKSYDELYPILKYDEHFLYNYGAELSLAKQYQKSIEILTEAESRLVDADLYIYLGNSYEGIREYKDAENAFKQACAIVPHLLYPKYRLVYIYAYSYQSEKAIALAKEIINTKEKIVSKTTIQIKNDMKKLVDYSEGHNSSQTK